MAFLAPIAAFAIANATTIAAISSVVATGATLLRSPKAAKSPALQPLKQSPNAAAIESQERENILRQSQAQTKTILTSPLGETGSQARIARKTLLGVGA